jgi:hypothetical protein
MTSKSKFDELNDTLNEDFLEVDKPIPGQSFVCLSFVSPDKILQKKEDYYYHEFNKKRFQVFQKEFTEKFDKVMNDCLDGKVDTGKLNELQNLFVKSTDEYVKQSFETFTEDLKDFKYANEEAVEEKFHEANDFQTTVRGIKVRGTYNTLKEAQIRAKVLQRMDPSFHIFVGQVGYWLPWDPTADKIENQEYLNNQLNDIVKKYKSNEAKRDEFYEQQKQEKKKATIKQMNASEGGSKMSIGGESDPVVSMEETANQLKQEDPWMARKLGSNTGITEIPSNEVEETGEVDIHDGADDNDDEE